MNVGMVIMYEDLQQCEDDPNNECDSQVCLSLNGGNLNYISNDDILGFQFNHMNCAVSKFGGYVEDNGFLLNTNENMLVALTLSGDVIPAGNGILLEGIGSAKMDIGRHLFFRLMMECP